MRGVFQRTEKHKDSLRKSIMLARQKLASLNYIGETHPSWKGGKPKCEICNKQLSTYKGKRCYSHKIFTETTRNKISEARRKSGTPWMIGRKISEDTRKRISEAKKGSNSWNWIEDRTKLSRISKQGERRTSIYFDWRRNVWIRDGHKCKISNQDCEGKIEAHHILSWRDYPELRYNINNGITLCHAHHPRKRAEEERLSPYFQDLVSTNGKLQVNL